MNTTAKIISIYNLLLLPMVVFLLILILPLILGLVASTLGMIVLTLIILVPLIWGVVNALRFFLGRPIHFRQLKMWEKVLAMIPLFNLALIVAGVLILFLMN